MTVNPFTPSPPYTVMTAGPYGIGWPYDTGEVRAAVILAGVRTDLVAGTDYSVAPAASPSGGNLTLTPAALAAFAGGALYLTRQSLAQQGWVGVLGEREKGLEAQLDLLTRRLQEIEQVVGNSVRIDGALPPFAPAVGAAIIFDGALHPVAGPTADQISQANADALATHADRLAADAAAATAGASASAAAASAAAADVRRNANQTFTGLNTFANDVTVQADKSLFMGSAQDAQLLYSTAGDKWIARAKTAATWLSARFSQVEFNNFDNTKSLIRGLLNGAVELYFNGLKRLETESAGVVVTGRLRETDRAAEAWHSVARTAGTFYQNTTGRSIKVAVQGLNGSGGGTLSLSVNSTATVNNIAGDSRSVSSYVTLGATVPPGHYYQFSVTGVMSINQVQELS